MLTSDDGIKLICEFEGFSPVPYKDVAGLATIGYGHLIKRGESFTRITKEQGVNLLRHDLLLAERAVKKLLPRELSQGQFDALVSFTFNLGSGSLQRSTLRQKALRYEDHLVPQEFMRWVYAGGKKWRGLIRRRYAEALLYMGV